MPSVILAKIVHYIHTLLVMFILSGIIYIPNKYLPYFISLIILVIMGWNDLFGVCFLTNLEYYFKTGKWSKLSAKEENGPEFFRPFIKSLTGIDTTREQADKINNLVFLSILLIAVIKYAHSVKNCL